LTFDQYEIYSEEVITQIPGKTPIRVEPVILRHAKLHGKKNPTPPESIISPLYLDIMEVQKKYGTEQEREQVKQELDRVKAVPVSARVTRFPFIIFWYSTKT
jgi:hypothetical protein